MSDLSRTFPRMIAALSAIGNMVILPAALHSLTCARFACTTQKVSTSDLIRRTAFERYETYENRIINELGVRKSLP